METIGRIIFIIYNILLAVFACGVIGAALGLIPLALIEDSFTQYVYNNWQVAIIGLVLLGVSVQWLFLLIYRRPSKREMIIHKTEFGDVHISMSAIENLLEDITCSIKGVRGVKIRSHHDDKRGIRASLRLIVSPDCNVPTVANEVKERVKEYMKTTAGLELSDIEVMVEDISNQFKVKRRVN